MPQPPPDTVLIEELKDALLSSDEKKASRILSDSENQYKPLAFVEAVIVPVLDHIGQGWANDQYALSQVYMSGRICEDLVDGILPEKSEIRKIRPKMAIALLSDYHSLGSRIVWAVLRASGYHFISYGRIEADELVENIIEDRLEVVLISVLMLPSALQVKDVVHGLRRAGCNAKIVVGGAPFRLDKNLWTEVGADAVGFTASDALSIVQSFTRGKPI